MFNKNPNNQNTGMESSNETNNYHIKKFNSQKQ